jgi:hypothetical protein
VTRGESFFLAMGVLYICALLCLAVTSFGVLSSFFYSLRIIYKLSFQQEENGQSVSLLKAAKLSATMTKTPIFPEPAWLILVGLVCLTLTFRAGWINSMKMVLQIEWQYDGSDQVMEGIGN